MKPPEILAMIEEAAGTRMYEAKKQQALKTIEKKEEKIKEINDILTEEVTPTLNKLREERTQYLQFQKTERELEHLNRQHVAYKFCSHEKNSERMKKEFEDLNQEKVNHHNTTEKLKSDIETLDKEIVELQHQRDQEGGTQLAGLEAQLRAQEKAESKAQTAVKVLKDTIKAEEKKKKELKKSLDDDKAALKGTNIIKFSLFRSFLILFIFNYQLRKRKKVNLERLLRS